MKLKEALKLAKHCGLETVQEAFQNIYDHCMNLFPYNKIDEELVDLYLDTKVYAGCFDMTIEQCLNTWKELSSN